MFFLKGEKNPLTALVVDLSGIDPDDAFSVVPYEKGSTFLWYLEDTVGGPAVFEPFLKSYYDHFKFQSIDSNQFKEYFLNYFNEKNLDKIDWEKWFYQPGMPIYTPNYDQTLAKACSDLAEKWVQWKIDENCPFTKKDLDNLTAEQKIEFLAQLLQKEPLSKEKMEKMEELYSLNGNNNSEIKCKWIRLGLKAKWMDAVPRAVQMVTEQGRMKFLRPIYR